VLNCEIIYIYLYIYIVLIIEHNGDVSPENYLFTFFSNSNIFK